VNVCGGQNQFPDRWWLIMKHEVWLEEMDPTIINFED